MTRRGHLRGPDSTPHHQTQQQLDHDRHRRGAVEPAVDRSLVHAEQVPNRNVELDLVEQGAFAVEHLDAPVGAVGHIDVALGVGGNGMHRVELAGASARRAPRFHPVAALVDLGDARIDIAVADIAIAYLEAVSCTISCSFLSSWGSKIISLDAPFEPGLEPAKRSSQVTDPLGLFGLKDVTKHKKSSTLPTIGDLLSRWRRYAKCNNSCGRINRL
jgi:hypothetical protein